MAILTIHFKLETIQPITTASRLKTASSNSKYTRGEAQLLWGYTWLVVVTILPRDKRAFSYNKEVRFLYRNA
jgi:hypothetical protein